jgi:hypothetical protein
VAPTKSQTVLLSLKNRVIEMVVKDKQRDQAVRRVKSNQLRPLLKKNGVTLLTDKLLHKGAGVKAVNRSGIPKLEVPKDILLTPAGKRIVKQKEKATSLLTQYVRNNYDGQLYEILMKHVINREWLVPRSLFAVETTSVKVPWLRGNLQVEGIFDHVFAYSQKNTNVGGQMYDLLLEKMDKVVEKFPAPLSYSAAANDTEWKNTIRTKTNLGCPYWVTTTEELRDEVFEEYKHLVTQQVIPDRTMFTLFTRTQPWSKGWYSLGHLMAAASYGQNRSNGQYS